MTTWAIRNSYRFDAVEVVKETAAMVFYTERFYSGGSRETRSSRGKFLDWRGDEKSARLLVEKLTSAKAEYDRRRKAAAVWYTTRMLELTRDSDASLAETASPKTGREAKAEA